MEQSNKTSARDGQDKNTSNKSSHLAPDSTASKDNPSNVHQPQSPGNKPLHPPQKRKKTQSQKNAKKKCTSKEPSQVWDHFTKIKDTTPVRAACNYCKKDAADSFNETSGTWAHLLDRCTKYPYRLNKGQKSITNYTKTSDGKVESNVLENKPLNVEEIRKELATMIVIDELPFKIVEGEGFRRYSKALEPRFIVPSRMTVARDCIELFVDEKSKLKKLIQDHRVCLTTDTWTSIQNLNYMCLTAHWIDNDWKYQKRIINFQLVESHAGRVLGAKIEDCLIDWGIDNVFTMTVDNATSNDICLDYLMRQVKWKEPILNNKYMHVRCAAHIVNLIVKDGLKEQDNAILRIRNAIRYVKSSPARNTFFKKCVDREKIPYQHLLCLDVETRWNATYKMLEHAEKFEKAFNRMGIEDPNYNSYFDGGYDGVEDEGNGDGSKKKRDRKTIGPPSYDDFQVARCFAKFLRIFYHVTLKFSGSLYVTSNAFFREFISVHSSIKTLLLHSDRDMRKMAEKMKLKFDKYWSFGSKTNYLLYVAIVLDPRYKLDYVDFCFGELYGRESVLAKSRTSNVESALTDLYHEYVDLYFSKRDTVGDEGYSHVSHDINIDEYDGTLELLDSQFAKRMESLQSVDNLSELNKYLKGGVEKNDKDFDLMNWWKVNETKYPVISKIAKDVLAIPVSTVASEQAFSTSGRVIDSFRSSLTPKSVEALICAQNWLRSTQTTLDLREAMEDVEKLEEIEKDII